ncbi:hypothetical protein A2755_00935 [Candidatus Wolfebacteria bacterium RIFCSPHIGHO2_01_FULL_48_22]|uniref:Four helix bundle protein n=2 Tax=Candidatus Wolfeibacteriota TaxID=1752735 RepID=A0A1F8DTX5_9BACT|nr:MAG: hypothetical protein A2755_00935 [Candidatus Wolfebacteria bacterium RIFCSPHIGHO2_01_FULL_48_22]OGM93577.1 MAG: hypothetical protein A2935_03050 [Candidatus Wolfebacteria bacterium RIFCSPLOWO2_01_FULL_47_17b]
MIKTYKDLEVYKEAQRLYPQVVGFSKVFPREGFYLKNQLCRAANSIGANIAEGFGRSNAEFKLYLTRSLGSCNEVVTHLQDSLNVRYGDTSEVLYLLGTYTVLGKRIYRLREKWF